MDFSMRINFVDVVCDNSLKNTYVDGRRMGLQFDIRLSYYRGQFLSVVDRFEVAADGEKADPEAITFCLHGKEFSICELQSCYYEFWNILEPATIKVHRPGGLAPGKHKIEVTFYFRSPYMAIGPNHQYMPIDSCGSKTLSLVG